MKTKRRRFQIPPPFSMRHFRDRLLRTAGLTTEIKLRFQISPAKCGRCLGKVWFSDICNNYAGVLFKFHKFEFIVQITAIANAVD